MSSQQPAAGPNKSRLGFRQVIIAHSGVTGQSPKDESSAEKHTKGYVKGRMMMLLPVRIQGRAEAGVLLLLTDRKSGFLLDLVLGEMHTVLALLIVRLLIILLLLLRGIGSDQ